MGAVKILTLSMMRLTLTVITDALDTVSRRPIVDEPELEEERHVVTKLCTNFFLAAVLAIPVGPAFAQTHRVDVTFNGTVCPTDVNFTCLPTPVPPTNPVVGSFSLEYEDTVTANGLVSVEVSLTALMVTIDGVTHTLGASVGRVNFFNRNLFSVEAGGDGDFPVNTATHDFWVQCAPTGGGQVWYSSANHPPAGEFWGIFIAGQASYSCTLMDTTTPVEATTWGAIKQLYQ